MNYLSTITADSCRPRYLIVILTLLLLIVLYASLLLTIETVTHIAFMTSELDIPHRLKEASCETEATENSPAVGVPGAPYLTWGWIKEHTSSIFSNLFCKNLTWSLLPFCPFLYHLPRQSLYFSIVYYGPLFIASLTYVLENLWAPLTGYSKHNLCQLYIWQRIKIQTMWRIWENKWSSHKTDYEPEQGVFKWRNKKWLRSPVVVVHAFKSSTGDSKAGVSLWASLVYNS